MNFKNDTTSLSHRKTALGRKCALLATVGASAAIFASAAYAQPASGPVESVTVSSSRITTAGFNAPTPTTVLGQDFIENSAKDTIFTVVTQLPSLMGSSGVESQNNGTSGGLNGLASFNMFGLGAIRTLTLLDGQRFVAANVTGIPDISEFPQILIQRVDVVTGGASASWGSDAIAGVINFITDKKFEGFKANISTGLSTYGDDASVLFQAAAGTSFAGGRGHFEIATEYAHQDGVMGGIHQLSCCGGRLTESLSNGRDWFKAPIDATYSSPGATPVGQPQHNISANGQHNNYARYGLINSGPLMGTAFDAKGSPYAYNYGTGLAGVDISTGLGGTARGLPNRDGSASTPGTVANCIGTFCIGGETDGQVASGVSLATPLTRGNVYTRLSYDLTPNTEIYMTYNWSEVGTTNIPNPTGAYMTSLPGIGGGTGQSNTSLIAMTTGVLSNGANNPGQQLQAPGIQCGNANGGPNAYLPASIQAACLSNNITSFSFGSLYYGLGPTVLHTLRDNRRLVGGVNGRFNLFDTDWTWNAYYEHGENDTRIHVLGNTLKPYFYAAIDSVQVTAANAATYAALKVPVGSIVCRSVLAIQEGCVPFNPFGGGDISQATKNWTAGGEKWGPGPYQLSHQMQDVADFAFSGSPLENWAGKVSVAAGATWRQEAYDVRADGAGNGTVPGAGGAPGSPCVDPLLNCLNGTNWLAGSFHNAQGNYHVIEAFLETNVPLIDSPVWGTANLNVAGRHARYSTAGDSNTWKAGLTWDTPIDGLRLRALQSRDVRAPNLSELYAAPTTVNNNSTDPWTGTTLQVVQGTYGNPLLKPERSLNTQLGFVLQPSWIPGWQFSLDYYRVAIAGGIGNVAGGTSVSLCFQDWQATGNFNSSYCNAIVVGPGTTPATVPPQWLQVNSIQLNQQAIVTDGFNLETSYQFSLDDWDFMPVPGGFSLRALATYVDKFITYPGLPGQIPSNKAGNNTDAVPHLKIFATQSYTADNWQVTLSENWLSEGRMDLSRIECTPGSCPASTQNNQTTNDNHVPGILYFNLGGSYDVNPHWKLYVQIDNLLNKSPPTLYGSNTLNPNNAGANPLLYDVIGRMFHVGVRVND